MKNYNTIVSSYLQTAAIAICGVAISTSIGYYESNAQCVQETYSDGDCITIVDSPLAPTSCPTCANFVTGAPGGGYLPKAWCQAGYTLLDCEEWSDLFVMQFMQWVNPDCENGSCGSAQAYITSQITCDNAGGSSCS
jgi:hypothetical protein